MEHHDVSRAAWLFTICPDQNKKNFNKLLYQKIVTIIEGGLNSYELKDIAVIVWSIGVWDIKDDDKHWTNI